MARNLNYDVSEKLNITVRKGDTVEIPLTFTGSNGLPVTLLSSGYEFFMQVRKPKSKQDRASVAQKSEVSEYGDLVIGSLTKGRNEKVNSFIEFKDIDDDGNLVIYISSDYTKNIEPGSYVYDLQQIVNGKTTTIFEGSFTVTKDISNVDAV